MALAPVLRILSSRETALQGSKRHVDTKRAAKMTLSVPKHKELGPGLLRKLIGSAGLTIEEFRALLD
jgi:hypothetical protein